MLNFDKLKHFRDILGRNEHTKHIGLPKNYEKIHYGVIIPNLLKQYPTLAPNASAFDPTSLHKAIGQELYDALIKNALSSDTPDVNLYERVQAIITGNTNGEKSSIIKYTASID